MKSVIAIGLHRAMAQTTHPPTAGHLNSKDMVALEDGTNQFPNLALFRLRNYYYYRGKEFYTFLLFAFAAAMSVVFLIAVVKYENPL
jgi:hypothetical protein